ncbi:MAG: InlB B-repeat-containing protein, partial [Solirubrobacteraceae bacterium]
GTLAIAVNNTTAGSGYSVLSVGGNVTLDGTLDLNPSSGYAASAQTGDTIGLLTYSGSRTGQFATTMVNPALDGGRSFTAGYRTAHQVDAVVGASTGQHTLTVSKAGSGSGTVTSSPAGIDCGSTCSAQFDDGTQVTLTVAPDTGSTFTGWSGGGCSGTQTTCTVKMGANVSVTASFARIWTLSVVKAGAGSGSAGIDCSGARSCSVDAVDGTKLTLTAAADAGSTFAGWSGGGCSGTQANCIVTLHSDQTVTATFATAPRSTTTGLVSSANPATVGQQVTYTATVSPAPGGGTVQFTDGGTAITGCGAVAVNLSDGTSSCQTSYGAAGQHSIQAIYSGTSAFGGSQSGALTESVSGTSGAAGGCNTLPARDAAVPSGGSQAHYEIVLEGVDLGAVQSVSGLGQLNSAPAQYGQPGGGAQSANQHTPVLIEAAQCSPADIGLAQWAQTWVAHGGTAFENVTIGVFDNAGNVVQSYAMTKANLTSVVPCQLNAGQNQICVNAYTFVFATFSAGTSTWPGQTSGAATVSNGAAVVTMNCASSKPCGGLLTLTAIVAGPAAAKGHHTIVLGKTRFRVRPHHQAKLSIRLSRAALRLLKRTHTLRAQLSIDPTGVPKSLSARRTIKLVKR